MKNIHVLPTDKPSSLFITEGRLFNYHKPQQGDGVKIINQNIYITNSEEIKQGDYGLVVNEILSYNKMIELWGLTQGWKIILTTDQDLIKDGVQAIDNEFLEWFVKNPSCEDVEVLFACRGLNGHTPIGEYKIIIPKEEDFKHELHVMSKEEVLANRSNAYEFIDFDKQETLEEVAEKFAKKFGSEIDSTRYYAFIAGAKWQQERMYSEEEIIKILIEYDYSKINDDKLNSVGIVKKWFKQFKNK